MTVKVDSHGIFEVVVVGAGPSGSAAAGDLERRGFRTALVSRSGAQRPNIGECLPPSIRPQLEKAGVWQEFLRAGHMPSFGIRSAWGSSELADRDFVLSPYIAGWHIDRGRFDSMMRDSAVRSGTELLECTAVRGLESIPDGWRLHLANDSGDYRVDARMVIDASGRASVIACRNGAKRNSLDRMVGVAGYFSYKDVRSSIEPMLLVEAVEDGWWYTAPLPDGRLIAVFMTDADIVQRQKLTETRQWMALLGSSVHQNRRVKEHELQFEGAIRIVRAESSFLDRVAGDGWLATGDAAAAFDPLSSQGIITAISSGLDAAQTAAEWLSGNEHAPAEYAKRLRHDYAEYLTYRGIYYGIEKRWPESGFWKSRQSAPAMVSRDRESVCA